MPLRFSTEAEKGALITRKRNIRGISRWKNPTWNKTELGP